jgi:Cell wall hydrolyses involved in spore germination
MNTRNRNNLLAWIVMVMLAAIAYFGNQQDIDTRNANVQRVYIPSDNPKTLAMIKAETARQQEFECLRMNIYHEAGNLSRRGMEAVALVTVHRTEVKHYPATICGVVTDAVVKNGVIVRNKCQFSWYCDGKSDNPNLRHPLEKKAWDRATAVAKDMMDGKVKDFLGRATHYHATYVMPDFALPQNRKRYNLLAKVGVHVFYRDIKLGLKAS